MAPKPREFGSQTGNAGYCTFVDATIAVKLEYGVHKDIFIAIAITKESLRQCLAKSLPERCGKDVSNVPHVVPRQQYHLR